MPTHLIELYIIGCGGHGRVVADSALKAGTQSIVFVDDSPRTKELLGWPVRSRSEFPSDLWRQVDYIVAIGNNGVRKKIYQELQCMGGVARTIVDPDSTVSRFAQLGAGVFVAPGAIINTGARIGENCIINTAAKVDHDCVVRPHVQVGPNAALAGNVTVDELVMIGIGASVVPGRKIGAAAVLGAGAVVTRDIPAGKRAWGVPARVVGDVSA